ncbi:hypothetical protein SLA_7122 [Streptomyces laurentii]|uniref:Uncharacterized protein n=1 Tax=Streptomyces laurentii TaxID=39478 RepID=A0A169PIM8_STRLU|nr:hypothetical protein SLA_7122 [Streptomyces laurentii]
MGPESGIRLAHGDPGLERGWSAPRLVLLWSLARMGIEIAGCPDGGHVVSGRDHGAGRRWAEALERAPFWALRRPWERE